MVKMQPVAYFSPEYAFDDLPIFAGGLGVLAADFLQEASQEDFPCVGLGLFYHYGFAPADDSSLEKIDVHATGWGIVQQNGQPLVLSLNIDGGEVFYQTWEKTFGSVTMYLMDCDIEQNSESDRMLTAFLYDKDFRTKFKQNALLGIGGVKLLEALDISPSIFHLNEGHSSLATIARMASHKRKKPHATFEELCEAVVAETVASKHTVLSGAGMYINHDLFEEVLGRYLEDEELPQEEVFALAQDPLRKDEFTTTRLKLRMANVKNAVSKSHKEYEAKQHPRSEFKLISITNGINLRRWQSKDIADAKTQDDLWQAHLRCKKALIEFVNDSTGSKLDSEALTFVWARRITSYKRPLEVFKDLDCLERILTNADKPAQLLIAGKPNIEDEVGVEMAREIGEHVLNPKFGGRIAYLSDYNLEVAHKLVTGGDVWLNTPEKGYEASGTSGMKAGSNGVLQCSVSDGWVDEVDISKGGWVLPDINTADTLYGYMEHEVAPLFYERDENGLPKSWVECMSSVKKLIETRFTTERMLKEYKKHLYRISD